ncbi:MAG: hypothetical protein WB778_08365 [Thermoplasmata archaeon]
MESRAALLVRYSMGEERPNGSPIASLEDSGQLTPEGRQRARHFGRKIPSFAHLILSHIRIACTRDTAEEIAAGFRESHPDSDVDMEGVDPAPGLTTLYAKDQALRDLWKEKLGRHFHHGWLEGQIPSEVLAPA